MATRAGSRGHAGQQHAQPNQGVTEEHGQGEDGEDEQDVEDGRLLTVGG